MPTDTGAQDPNDLFAQQFGTDVTTEGDEYTNIKTSKNSIFGVDTGVFEPLGYETNLVFGKDSAQSDFMIPMARFKFYDPFGSPTPRMPVIYIRMPGSFNSTLTNTFSAVQNVYGSPIRPVEGQGAFTQIGNLIKSLGESGIGALQRQILEAITQGAGFIGSAGVNSRAQAEFLTRKMLNNYNQMIYQGPIHRQFQLPFSMRPSTPEESVAMKDIIYCFRAASSPKAGGSSIENQLGADANVQRATAQDAQLEGDLTALNGIPADKLTTAQKELIQTAQNKAIEQSNESALILGRMTDAFTFGYPEMVKFQIVLAEPNSGAALNTHVLFKSDFCVMQAVTVDYGSGNKLNFFHKNSKNGDEYHPTEATLSLSLTEMNLVTAGTVFNQYNNIQ